MPPVTSKTVLRAIRVALVIAVISVIITAVAQGLTRAPLDGFALGIAAGIPLLTGLPTLIWIFGVKEQLRLSNAALTAANRILHLRAMTDALTGLWMRDAFFEEMEAARTGILLMIDADHFKSINDRFGHLSGDIVLKEIAEAIRSSLRERDVAGRLGGEEFAVYLPNTKVEAAWAVAERILRAVESLDMRSLGDQSMRVTVSIGIAKATEERTRSQVLAAGDRQLYRSKEAGRNRATAE